MTVEEFTDKWGVLTIKVLKTVAELKEERKDKIEDFYFAYKPMVDFVLEMLREETHHRKIK